MSARSVDTEVLVVGAGPAGTTAALRAAADGREVVLTDLRPHIGGAIHAYDTPHGSCDAGPHLLTGLGPGQMLADCWQALGVQLPALRPIRPAAELLGPDGQRVAAADPAGLREALETARGRHALDVLLAAAHEMLELPWDIGIPQFLTVPVRAPTFLKLVSLTLDEALDLLEVPAADRWKLGGYWGFVGMPPARISAVFYAYLLRIWLEEGGWRPRDGLGALQASLADAVTGAGVDWRPGVAVDGLRREAGAWVVELVETAPGWTPSCGWDGKGGKRHRLRAAHVIWAADPRPLASTLTTAPARWRRQLQAVESSMAGLRLSAWAPEAAGPDERLDLRDGFVGEIRERGWLHRYTYVSARAAGEALDAARARLREGLPEAEEAAETTPAIHAAQLGVADGALYGAAFGPDQVGFARIQPRTPWPDLLLAGHWTSPGSGVAGAAISGDRAARLLGRRRPLLWRRTA